ncbi:MAG TPA: aldehyde dehydrogenase [Bacteroidales bacterium]|jgi:aldehyde dehydrogenase (NAD+)|nr:aldehyde dehydrogenase [Bacteroidales bacterium]OQC58041.1 MAG: Aldehyde dehydrogenase [Bacteroidetes bacterium ADurb.Bin013]MCZ2315838.1 aldehyde dehydrogenase [Bacteroidales bacterium]NLZ08612.1 aldehyde dehydrogenase [Bacteroidales bacterium]HOF76559.1 aldehyde dehydrogenase [Bacteroidales bacterium]
MITTDIVSIQREYFLSGCTRDLKFRLDALHKIATWVKEHEQDILEALKADLNKSATEGYLTEIGVLLEEIRYLSKNLHRWIRKRGAKTPLLLVPAKSYRVCDPYGVVLIMSPWNYPVLLSLDPLVGAIAAGNCAIVKPSAYSPNTSSVIARMARECFPPEFITVVEGGRAENAWLLEQPFDYIFFTGSTSVGRKVMEAASAHLTPVSLELGGKSPVIIEKSADVDLAAKRIVFGKFINAGQTCVAPDYILVPEGLQDQLQERLIHWIDVFYPADEHGFIADYPHIVNEKHFDRLLGLLQNQKIIKGGQSSRQTLTINPTLLTGVLPDDSVMQEEIFGPILPLITCNTISQAIEFIRNRPKPLALYLFTKDNNMKKRVLQELSFGGGCVNDTLLHVASSNIPFGGVGASGMGAYHGKASFDTFTHFKSIVDKGIWPDPSLRYRPYSHATINWLKKFF